jgi:peptidoglycan biosynthesis protein MviN/MurJ (putative lipid II flippase)
VAASTVPTIIYDFLIGGAISAALVPVLSDYADDPAHTGDLSRMISTLLTLAAIVLGVVIVVLIGLAPELIGVLGIGFAPDVRADAIGLVRLMLPAAFFMAISGIFTALLYARQRFVLPAFVNTAYNAGIIVIALLLGRVFGIQSLVLGVLVGALMQVLLQWPALRGLAIRPSLDFSHPGLRRALKLYLPVAVGFLVTIAGIFLDRNLASRTGEGSMASMRFATTLIQFPLGLVSVALSAAILPTLSRQATAGGRRSASSIAAPEAGSPEPDGGRRSASSIAAPEVGSPEPDDARLSASRIAAPEAGSPEPDDARLSASRIAAPEAGSPEPDAGKLSASRTDVPLVPGTWDAPAVSAAPVDLGPRAAEGDDQMPADAGAYKSTLALGIKLAMIAMIPAMVGLIVLREPLVRTLFERGRFGAFDTERTALAFLAYAPQLPFVALDQLLIAAFYARKNTLTPVIIGVVSVGFYIVTALTLIGPWGMPGLALANAVQNSSHAVILFVLLWRATGGLQGFGIGRTTLKVCAASAAMGVVTAGLLGWLGGSITGLLAAAAAGAAAYVVLAWALGVEELRLFGRLVRQRLRAA